MSSPLRFVIAFASILHLLAPAHAKKTSTKPAAVFSDVKAQLDAVFSPVMSLPGGVGQKLRELVDRGIGDARQAGERLKTEAMNGVQALKTMADQALAKALELKDRIERGVRDFLNSLPFNQVAKLFKECKLSL